TSSFTPTATQWRTDSVDLSAYASNNEVLIRFKAQSGYGNNLYIDDVNIFSPTGISDDNVVDYFTIYPNPAGNMINIDYLIHQQGDVVVSIYDITGKKISMININDVSQGNHNLTLDISDWTSGLYHAVITTENGVSSHKFVKQ
ncbi:MAG: T9SS type A sorting domain-containing protein, partial [Bacteroidales bacterium]|nr:T9SS type A sorting domain-containing protein [Bacteroidales bacterium]